MTALIARLTRTRTTILHKLRLYWQLIKSLQTGLLIVTGVAGFMSARCPLTSWGMLLAVISSLGLAIAGSTILNMVYDRDAFDPAGGKGVIEPFSHDVLWDRFARFMGEMAPVAEEANVRLALHPDDPPLPTLRGTPRLVYNANLYQRVLDLVPSPMNTLEFCIGTLAEMNDDNDLYEVIDRYSKTGRIAYVHFRNVRGKVPFYDEMFVDDGDVDMARALGILYKNGYDGVMIPDHTPAMSCAAPWHAGMAYALGWMRGVIGMLKRGG